MKELNSKVCGSAIRKLFELDKEVNGFKKVFVSCKPDGANGLMASYFIWGTKDGVTPEDELDFNIGNVDFDHKEVLNNYLNNQQ